MDDTLTSASGADVAHPAARCACDMLAQCRDLIERLGDDEYIAPLDDLNGATIGQHVRHAIDHVEAVIRGIDSGEIDYDHRDRGTPVETSRTRALVVIDSLIDRLTTIDGPLASRSVRVRVMLTAGGDESLVFSSLARELAFAAHHEVHHHAMIGVAARRLDVELPAGFGKAPATLNHEGGRRR